MRSLQNSLAGLSSTQSEGPEATTANNQPATPKKMPSVPTESPQSQQQRTEVQMAVDSILPSNKVNNSMLT